MAIHYPTDPIVLAAQARAVIQILHKQDDIVVRFKTNESGFKEDELDDLDKQAPGHFRPDKNLLTLNLDTLIGTKAPPRSLASVEDFRLFPVLAGVAAHEAGHARWSLWSDLPETIPNPDYDPFDPTTHVREVTDEDGETTEIPVPESFKVSGNGKLVDLAGVLEEPRIERLGVSTFTKTWRKAMQMSAGHLVLEQVDEMDQDDRPPLDAAVRMAILVGGRATAGTLGVTYESRKAVKTVLDSAQSIIEKAVANLPEDQQTEDPYHEIMGIINKQVFNNEHEDATSSLEAARQILKIIHPEQADDPDKPDRPDENEEEGDEGEGGAGGLPGRGESPIEAAALKEMADKMREAIDGMAGELAKMVESEEEAPEDAGGGGHGSVLYRNPQAPQIARHEQPNDADRALYKRALDWMQRQIEPTVTEAEVGQWLPTGGAKLNVRSMVRDNLAGHKGSQRSDWDRVSETVKAAPPVKVGIMLDGSGSMMHMARPSASIAWAAANAAAALPESRTVSVVYGNAAAVTQEPGHMPARLVAVSKTDGGTEEFIGAAKMVEEALWLDAPMEEGEPTNVLIIIISDLHYGGSHRHPNGKTEAQMAGFARITKEWADKGFQIVVVGADQNGIDRATRAYGEGTTPDTRAFTVKAPGELFK